jgi:2,5-diamino-6-(ribosylamino)-4(3H)-pyrimidinone 5'-phosphate reductase
MSQIKKNLYLIINVAMTADGKIDTFERKGAKISSADDWHRVDQLRTEVDAIMVGGRTLMEEDPRLTVKTPRLRTARRSRGLPENPTKVGVISQAKLNLDGRFINDGPARVLIFTSEQTSKAQITKLEQAGVEVFTLGEKRVELAAMLSILSELGIRRLLVEGGGTLNSALIQADLVDEIHIYIAPMIFGGVKAPTLADGLGLSHENAIQLKTTSVDPQKDGGIIIRYHVIRNP